MMQSSSVLQVSLFQVQPWRLPGSSFCPCLFSFLFPWATSPVSSVSLFLWWSYSAVQTSLCLLPNLIVVYEQVQINPSRLKQGYSSQPWANNDREISILCCKQHTWQVGFCLFLMGTISSVCDTSGSDNVMCFLSCSSLCSLFAQGWEEWKCSGAALCSLLGRIKIGNFRVPEWIFLKWRFHQWFPYSLRPLPNLLEIGMLCSSSKAALWDFGIHRYQVEQCTYEVQISLY